MSKMLPIAKIGESLRLHLSLGGTTSDEVGMKLIRKYAETAITIDEIQAVAQRHSASAEDFEIILKSSIDVLMAGDKPNPCVKCGPFPVLVGSLIFQEPFRLKALLEIVAAQASEAMTKEERNDLLKSATVEMTIQTYVMHNASRGEATFSVIKGGSGLSSADQKGCFGLILICGLLGGLLSAYAVRVLS